MTGILNKFSKTRIAPTPSGFLHLGNVLSFAITAALAQKTGAEILLRIDDLDQARVSEQYLQDIFDTLNFLNIPWDEGPRTVAAFKAAYSQIHRMAAYNEALKILADNGMVFACTCSRKLLNISGNNNNACSCISKNIALTAGNVSWRLMTGNKELTVKNYNGDMVRTTLPPGMKNFVVRKKDGYPSYQLASLVDDLYYGIDLIIRGEDLWPSTLAQHELSKALCENTFSRITFYHHPLLMETPGKKLSKSAGATSIKYFRENGKTAGQVYSLIAEMLGIHKPVADWGQLVSASFTNLL